MRRFILVVAGAALALSACQGASEVLTEQILEQVDGVDNVEIDTDTGEVRIETDEGSVSIGGGELPDGFPVPVPDGGEVMSVFSSSQEEASVSLSYPIDRYDELVAFYSDWTAGQPGEWNTSTSTFNSGGQTTRTTSWFGDTTNANVNIGVVDCHDFTSDTDQYNAACVTIITNSL